MRTPAFNPIMVADCLTAVCVREVAQYSALKIPRDIMALIVASNSFLENELMSLYDPTVQGLDTLEREDLLDTVAKYFTGRNWPTYGDRDDGSFLRELAVKAIAAGAELVPDRLHIPKVKTMWISRTKVVPVGIGAN